LKVLLPDVNESRKEYWGAEQTVRIGLMQLKGFRDDALEALLQERKRRRFESLEDFLCRVELHPSDTKILIKSGALDSIAAGATRPEMIWRVLAWHEARGSRRPVARLLFNDMGPSDPPRVPHYSPRTILEHELETLGFLISRHPLALYREPLARLKHVRGTDLGNHVGRRVTTIGWWVTGKIVTTKEEEPMEFISFEDTSALYETIFFPQAYARFCHMLNRSRPYVLTGVVGEEFGVVTLTVDSVRFL
jgi:error-prone DNA polymerase